jgi:hypothetical protein
LLPRYNAAVERLREVYPALVAALAPLLQEIMIVDAIAREVMNRKPDVPQANADNKSFQKVELAARNLAGAALGCRLIEDLRLPAFNEDHKMAWPIDPNSPWFAELRQAAQSFFPHDAKRLDKELARVEKLNQKFIRQQIEQAQAETKRRVQAETAAAQAAADARQRHEQQEAARIKAQWGSYPGSPT